MEVGIDGEIAAYHPRDGRRKLFKFDRVFGADSSQELVYEDTSALIRSVLDGGSRLLCIYNCSGLQLRPSCKLDFQ